MEGGRYRFAAFRRNPGTGILAPLGTGRPKHVEEGAGHRGSIRLHRDGGRVSPSRADLDRPVRAGLRNGATRSLPARAVESGDPTSRIFSLHGSFLVVFLGMIALLAASRRFVKNPAAREWIFAGSQVAVLLLIVDIDARGILFLVLPFFASSSSWRRRSHRRPGFRPPWGPSRGRSWFPWSSWRSSNILRRYDPDPGDGGGGVEVCPFTVVGLSYLVFKAIPLPRGRLIGPGFRPDLPILPLLHDALPHVSLGPMDRYGRFRPRISRIPPSDAGRRGGSLLADRPGPLQEKRSCRCVRPFRLRGVHDAGSRSDLRGKKPGLRSTPMRSSFTSDFSGYSDLAIGSARLFGIAMPENFRNPYFKRNIIEFWTHGTSPFTWPAGLPVRADREGAHEAEAERRSNLPVASASTS